MTTRVFRDWQSILSDFQLSSLRSSDYCRKNNLPLSTFYKWQRRLASGHTPASAPAAKFVEVTAPIEPETPKMVVKIVTTSGCVIEVPL